MTARPHYDLVILGAGPAGSVLGLRCAQLGLRSLIVEREPFPRPRLGESISAGCLQQLQSLGIGEAIAALRFPVADEIGIRWGSEWQTRHDPYPGLLVDRGAFDALLLRMAQAHGAEVWQPARLLHRSQMEQGWRLRLGHDTTQRDVQCRWLIDASGRQRALRLPLRHVGASTWAMHAEWPQLPPSPRLAATAQGWLWRVPLPAGMSRIFVFKDATELRRQRAASSLAAAYRQAVVDSEILDQGEISADHGRVLAVDASAAQIDWPLPDGLLAVGDAALQIDPLAASGVQVAIQTALLAALVLNTALHYSADRNAALAFYQQALCDTANRHRRFAQQHYAAAGISSAFWRDRSGTELETQDTHAAASPLELPRWLQLGETTHWEDAPCALTDRIALRPTLVCTDNGQRAAFLGGRLLRDLFPLAGTKVPSTQLPGEAVANLLRSGLLRSALAGAD
ncbi:NAD(P)/FAD-dependent oxidoreductase [Pseudomarimonas arenosa]|uniref:NAD(P)/FAD-dependent oxidoreductase n=1 Tax=Pseudomarimonas arenosa TaxID=2774145 RepID=A0AAW3ZMX4_9GAMM|nr:NAD(P)/FAD-dependent oxidoreductase [Pseudomarimonas arenosa]MBD8526270.1 NAD(P)/FAD-dependent oxidoreductase [Pseudomarimonas arenosa]